MKFFFGSLILFLSLMLSACSIPSSEQGIIDNGNGLENQANEIKGQNQEPEVTDSPNLSSCDYWRDKEYQELGSNESMTSVKDRAGSLRLSGKIVQNIENAAWQTDEKVIKIYFLFDSPTNDKQQLFYNYYYTNAAKGNTVNRALEQSLLFRLGIMQDSNLASSANISSETKERIISHIDTDDNIELELTIPIYNGMGVTDSFSYACYISE